MLKDSVCCGI